MAWRLAQSLITLRDEVNRMAPNRSKESDGTIGDQAHASRASRHNPNAAGVVTAMDITSDPGGGMPIHDIAEQIVANPNRHPELSYVISNRRTAGRSTGWRWVAYSGTNPHEKHVHFGVGNGPDSAPTGPYDSSESWNLQGEEDEVSKQDVTDALNEAAVQVYGVKSFVVWLTTVLAVARDANDNAERALTAAQKAEAAAKASTAPVIDYSKLAKALVAELSKPAP